MKTGFLLVPYHALCALVFLGLLARICEMAVLVRWAKVHWEQLREPLGFTRSEPVHFLEVRRLGLTYGKTRIEEWDKIGTFGISFKQSLGFIEEQVDGRWISGLREKLSYCSFS